MASDSGPNKSNSSVSEHVTNKNSENFQIEGSVNADSFSFSESPNMEDIRALSAAFVRERNWDVFHQPRNILLALVGEVGELAELFQWRGEVAEGVPDWTSEEKIHLAQELSDVMIYLIRLAEKCHVDLPSAVIDKIALNKKKYPVEKVCASGNEKVWKKYSEYD